MLWLWLGFFAIVGVLLLLHRTAPTPTPRRALYRAGVWFMVGLSFAGFVYAMYEHVWFGATLDEPSDSPGADGSMMFVSAYLLEYALAFDTIVVVSLLCEYHRVPVRYRPRVVFWGLAGAIVFRPFILAGAVWVARAFEWPSYVFGALCIYLSVKVLMQGDDEDMTATDVSTVVGQRSLMPLATRLRRSARLTTEYDYGGAFWLIRNGRRVLTMAGACALSLVLVEAAFVLDTVVTIVSVSKTTFIVVTSNILAAIAVRSWLSMPGSIASTPFPRLATAILFVVLGARVLAHEHVHVPHAIMLAVIACTVCVSFLPLLRTIRRGAR